uniref:TPX2 C-terminal domain-containing protein n=1 Tax=Kalanchoe fedtschenkoi TaxID=63787 RepID=A0A7N0UAV4_KALFE
MAGQMEEPISFNFQADSVHSGSVSFGRFANEPLLWERRSSFSHNRVLEEVARCSKHRIVTEKKAYFEAQLKKRALLRQGSLDEHNGSQYESQGSLDEHNGAQYENGKKDHLDLSSQKEDYKFVHENENDGGCETSVNIDGYGEEYHYTKESQIAVHFDESSDTSNDFDEKEMIDCHVEGREVLITERPMSQSCDCAEATAKTDDRTAALLEVQTVIDCSYSRCNSVEPEIEMKQNIYGDACYAEEEYKSIDLCAKSQKAEKELDAVSDRKEPSSKLMIATGSSGSEVQVKVTHTQGHSLSDAANKSFRILIRDVKQSTQQTKTFKHSKLNPISTANKWNRSPNPVHRVTQSTNSISKSVSGSKSGSNESKGIKVTESRATALKKDSPTTQRTLNRPEKIPPSDKSGTKTCPASFRFKSEVRAEKRKELLARTDQNFHKKETEINQIHTKTQEKTEAQIKLPRRGLNFKAKPMPSFYNEAKRKDAIINTPQKNPSHVMSKVVMKSTHLKAEGGLSKSPSQFSKICRYPVQKPTKTGAVSLSGKNSKSAHPSAMREPADTMKKPQIDRGAKLKHPKVLQNADVIKGKGTTGTLLTVDERTKKCTAKKVLEKGGPAAKFS